MNDRTEVTKTSEPTPQVPESALAPAVDISESDVGIELVADLPGVRKDGLAVKVDGAQLTIEGSAQIDVPQDLEPLYGEIRSRHFRRSFTLSPELDPSRIEARLSNGVLRMRIPKSEAARPRRIEIRAQ
jgi:HSP20 family molecular chaperone IbpA